MARSSQRRVRDAHVANATLRAGDLAYALVAPQDLGAAERRVATALGLEDVVLFASARGALRASFIALSPARRVVLQAFTCIAVPNAAIAAGLRTEFADVDEHGLLDVGSLSEVADDDIVVVQDTFGLAAELPAKGKVIRDAAHRVDLVLEPGSAVSVTSFEQSKWLSAGRGGLAVPRDAALAERLREVRDETLAGRPSYRGWLFTVVLTLAGRASYAGLRGGGLGMRLARKLDSDRFHGQGMDELSGGGIPATLAGRPDRLTVGLIERQIRRLVAVREHRARIVHIYDRASGIEQPALPLLRYPMVVADPGAFESHLRRAGWDVTGRWFGAPLHPAGADGTAFGFKPDATPRAAELASKVVNLPTHPLVNTADAEQLVETALEAGARPLWCAGIERETRV